MKATLSPERICADVANNVLNRDVATQFLISLIEESNDSVIRAKSIDSFRKLSIKTNKAFRIIENCLISDEHALVRTSAAQTIFYNFPKKKSFIPLKWAIQHEESSIVIRALLDLFESVNDPHFNIFKKELIRRLDQTYSVVPKEINLFLNLEVLYAEFAEEYEFKVGSAWYKIMELLKSLPNTTRLIQRLHYIKLGGKKFLSLPDDSLSYLRNTYLK